MLLTLELFQAKPVIVKKATPPPVPLPVKKAPPVRRASTSIPAARRTETDTVVRPKREIHPPPPKDLSYSDMPRKGRKSKRVKDDGSAEQLRYCKIIIQELFKKQHYDCASHFYEPVGEFGIIPCTIPLTQRFVMEIG